MFFDIPSYIFIFSTCIYITSYIIYINLGPPTELPIVVELLQTHLRNLLIERLAVAEESSVLTSPPNAALNEMDANTATPRSLPMESLASPLGEVVNSAILASETSEGDTARSYNAGQINPETLVASTTEATPVQTHTNSLDIVYETDASSHQSATGMPISSFQSPAAVSDCTLTDVSVPDMNTSDQQILNPPRTETEVMAQYMTSISSTLSTTVPDTSAHVVALDQLARCFEVLRGIEDLTTDVTTGKHKLYPVQCLIFLKTARFLALFNMSVCLSDCLSACLSICVPVCSSVFLSICESICVSICLSACPSVCLSVYLSACPSVCPSVCVSICVSI